jgi:uncharacterized protein YjdB
MKKTTFFLMLTLIMMSAASMHAQVLIGGTETDNPREGAILDLKSTTQGLILPSVELENIGKFQLADTPAEGMTVYNSNDKTTGGSGKGIYVWNEDLWLYAGYYSGPLVIPVTGVTVTSPANVLLSGAGMQFTATVAPDGATNKAVFWTVTPGTGTGTITQGGLFTAEAPGTVHISAVSAENAAIKGTKTITVTVPAIPVEAVSVRSNGNATTVVVAGTLQLYADVTPANADNRTVTWSSDNTAVATVNATSGLVTAKAQGTVRITATAIDGSAVSDYIDLTVTPVLVTGFTITPTATSIRYNQEATLTAGSFTPSNAALKEVTWEYVSGPEGSRMPEEVTTATACIVYSGEADGTITIKATAKDVRGFEKIALIDVANPEIPVIPVSSISLAGSTCVRNDNAIRIYPSTISPATASNKALSWSITGGGGKIQSQSDDECWIVADGSGGSIRVTASATDGSGKTASYTSYGVVGADEEGEVLNDGTFEYTTWKFSNGVGQWMTKNSRYGTPTWTNAADGTVGEGYWYNATDAETACIQGWHVPVIDEIDALRTYYTSGCLPSGAKSAFWGSGRVAGYISSSAGTLSNPTTLYFPGPNGTRSLTAGGSFTNTGLVMGVYSMAVRCIKD